MRNYIILNGQNSNSISGLLIQSLAPISKPLMRTEIEEIDGRDGDITTKLGYSAYDKEITIGLYGNYDINEVIAYFNSEGTVIFSSEPDKYYNYQIAAQIDFERLVRYKTATVTMHCQPFKYSATEGTEIFGASSNLVTIPDFSRTTNGITVTVSDGLMTVSGKGSAATEFYVPIDTLSLAAGSYTMTAIGSGTAPEACSLRVIYDSPSSANSFGGNYVTLKNNTDVSLSATLTATKTYNYVYLYIAANKNMNFTLNLQIVDQAQAVVSDEGTNLVLEGSAEAPFSQFDLKGNTGQQTYSGKNLCGIPDQTFTHMGVTVTIKDGEVTMNGTSTGTGTKSISPIKTTTLNGSYTTNLIYVSGTAGSGNFNLRKASDSSVVQGTQTTFASSNSSASYTITSTDVIFGFYILATGTVFTNYKFKIQIVAGSTADYNFEPYTAGASPNPDYPQAVQTVTGENVISITGKNLFDYTTYRQSGQGLTNTLNADGTITTTGIPTGNYARIVPNLAITDLLEDGATYTLSKTISGNLVAAQVQAAKVSGGNDYYTGTFTVNKSTHTSYLITAQTTTMEGWGSESRTITCGYQLEKGSSASQFEPYQEQSYEVNLGNIELCKIGTYQDYIYKSGDKWYKHSAIGKYVYNNNLSQNGISATRVAMITPTLNVEPNIAFDTGCFFSNMFTPTIVNETGVRGTTSASRIRVEMSTSFADSYDGFRALAAANNLTVYYPLATPSDTEITNQALVGQLDDIYYHAHAYKERTHIRSLVNTGNVPHIIAAAVAANMGNITVTNSGNFISKPTMTIFGSGNIGVYLNGIQLFQIALGDTEYITIDCAAMEAYKDTLETLQNRLVTGDYSNFVLNPGDNTISFTGSVTKFEISNYSRWL